MYVVVLQSQISTLWVILCRKIVVLAIEKVYNNNKVVFIELISIRMGRNDANRSALDEANDSDASDEQY